LLETNPKQYPKKQGKLKNLRAADVQHRNVTFRAVFAVDEVARVIKVLSFAKHDVAYARAVGRK
jgi:hypothetical protein